MSVTALRFISLAVLVVVLHACVAARAREVPFVSDADTQTDRESGSWTAPPHPDSSGHLIFDTIANLLQHWSNTYYRNGHTIVPATISPGTLLFHGSPRDKIPDGPEWMSFDEDHSTIFAIFNSTRGTLFSLVATRELHVLYFDGLSAARLPTGTVDAQSVLIDGHVSDDFFNHEDMLKRMCDWGEKHSIDGFIRTSYAFELVYCNFTKGIEVVSSVSTITWRWAGENWPDVVCLPGANDIKSEEVVDPKVPLGCMLRPNPPSQPENWKGSLPNPSMLATMALQTGFRHDFSPVPGIKIDYSKLLSFYDPRYESLVEWRRTEPLRLRHRLNKISLHDGQLFQHDLNEVLSRPKAQSGSGIAWGEVVRHIVERHADRIDWLRWLLRDVPLNGSSPKAEDFNATQVMFNVRQHILTMLTPYMSVDAVPPVNASSASSEWLAPTIDKCSSIYTIGASKMQLTSQELLIKSSIEETSHEICRTIGVIWLSAFAAEDLAHKDTYILPLLRDWKYEVELLKSWLGWAVWEQCHPACAEDEICVMKQWPWDGVVTGKELPQAHCFPRTGWKFSWVNADD